jgi:hypothetical protein
MLGYTMALLPTHGYECIHFDTWRGLRRPCLTDVCVDFTFYGATDSQGPSRK